MKKLLYICLLLVFAAIVAACSNNHTNDLSYDTSTDSLPSIVSIGPAITEVLVELGAASQLIAVDTFSAMIPGVPAGLPQFDMMAIDAEAIMVLGADKVFATEMIRFGEDPLTLVAAAGTQVTYVSVSNTLDEIMTTLEFIGQELGRAEEGYALAQNMREEIEQVRSIAATIATPRTVYFEIGSAPSLFTFGEGTFLNEILELTGAINIFAADGMWIAAADEQILARDPYVILTNDIWVEDSVGDISARPGWSAINAVANGRIFTIDADSSSRDNHNVLQAMWEIARAVYPEYFN